MSKKVLLTAVALTAFSQAVHAAESPLRVVLGGSVDFRAALFHESEKVMASGETKRRGGDVQAEYDLTVLAEGKASGGVDYGALVNLDNEQSRVGADEKAVTMEQAYLWVSGAFGKALFGDETGASDLFVSSPTVGEGQSDGAYTNFTDATTLAEVKPTYIDLGESSTKITYYTPKIGDVNHKVQFGASYAVNAEQGTVQALYDDTEGYKNQIEAVAQYTGTFNPVSVVVSPMISLGEGEGTKTVSHFYRDYTVWGVGAQALYAGITLGGSYVDAGHIGSAPGQEEAQDAWTVGLGYEFNRLSLAANYMRAEGYFNGLAGADSAYVDSFDAMGFGAAYTWFPGLTTAADAVFFDQSRKDATADNKGQVLMLSQKMTF